MSAPILEFNNVSRYYGETVALSEVSFKLAVGQSIYVRGENGAGKSTLLALAAGALTADCGEIWFCGEKRKLLGAPGRKFFSAIGYMSARSMLYRELTVGENLQLAVQIFGAKAADSLLLPLQLTEHVHKRISQCSTGIVRRVSLARALIGAPSLLILDEPFANIDTNGISAICSVLAAAKEKGVAMLVANHQQELSDQIPGQELVLQSGRCQK